jgi:hypothetical protein
MRVAEAGAARWSPERSWRPPTPCASNSPPRAPRARGGGPGIGRALGWGHGPPPPPRHTRGSLLAYEFPHNRWAMRSENSTESAPLEGRAT